MKQATLRDRVTLPGFGVHSNAPVRLVLHPANADAGISFLRTGLENGRERQIEASHHCVSATELCTVIGDPSGVSVATIEHLLAALAGLGITNALVEIDGPEVPILDGSSGAFVAAIDAVGVLTQSETQKQIRVTRAVRVERDGAWAEFQPHARGFRLDIEIDFATPLIGRQRRVTDLTPAVFRREIARARTFGFMRDVEHLWKRNLALGASLENTVALGEDRVINPEGLRWPDEFVRHKTLDAIGDLSLAGAPIQALFRSYKPGHKLNAAALNALMADRSAYEIVDAAPQRVRAATSMRIAAAAFAPER